MPQPSDTARKVYVETLGCQMNENDSELMVGLLAPLGFSQTPDRKEADLAIINTCQIRANAEDKAYSYLGAWGKLKENRPGMRIAMAGCVAQQTQDDVFERMPFVDMVIGTQNIHDLPKLVRKAFPDLVDSIDEEPLNLDEPLRLLATDRQKPKSTYEYFDNVVPERQNKVSAWVTIIEGCDYFCTYCVVPYTRGRQISRPVQSILDEVKQLADLGYQEITLLGQTVDAYGRDFTDKHYSLANLLEDIHEQAPTIPRIRFMTSHPLDLTDDIIDAIAALPRVMEYIHIPMQAGSNEILERMRRGYTREQYFDLVDKIRNKIPGVAITGDFIVGFPGETEAQFEESLDAIRRARFDLANTAAYSARKQTPAGIWEERGEGVITTAEKDRRLIRMNDVIAEVGLAQNLPYYGQTVEVLVEGKSHRKHIDKWRARTRTNKLVHFEYPDKSVDLTGKLVNVTIDKVGGFSMQAQPILANTATPVLV